MVPKVAVNELRRALDRVELWGPARRLDVSYFILNPYIHCCCQDIIKAGSQARQHCLEVPRDDYLSHYWQEVRVLQSELLLAEVVATYKKRLWVIK